MLQKEGKLLKETEKDIKRILNETTFVGKSNKRKDRRHNSGNSSVGKIQIYVPVFTAKIILNFVILALRYSRSCSVTRTVTTMSTVLSALYEKP